MKIEVFPPGPISVSEIPTIFLHGFPGMRSGQNRDVAEGVARVTGKESHVFLYEGLSRAPGEFSFPQCLAQTRSAIDDLRRRGINKLDLVGHSWGGFLALSLASLFAPNVRRLVLMSPLLYFVEQANAYPFFRQAAVDHPALRLGDIDARAREFEQMGRDWPTEDLIASIPESVDILFLQARDDETTPTSIAVERLSLFKRYPMFELVDTDHSFLTGRDWLTARIATFLESGA